MTYKYQQLRCGLTRKMVTALTRGLDSLERGDFEDLEDQLTVLDSVLSNHAELLFDVIESLEIERYVYVLERALDSFRRYGRV